MGYTIPSGDYSLPPLQVNVGAELGKTIGGALQAYGVRRDKQRKEAKELLETQNAMRNTIAIKQAELKTEFNASLKASGIEKGSSLFNQYQEVIKQKGQQAMEAQMNMNFGTDITDEQRAEYANSINSFKVYAKSSLTQMSRLIADVDFLNNEKYIVTGNARNGEQLVNRIALGAIGDVNEEVYGAGVIVDKKLTEENGSNIVSSTVKIPTNSKFFKQVADSGGRGIYDQLQAGISNGKIVEKDGYYVFKNTINVSNYESRGGMDYLQEKIDGVKPNDFLMNSGVLGDEAEFINLSEPIITSGEEIDSNGKKTGYFRVGETQIVNLAASTNSKEFKDQLSAEYDRVFKSGRSVSQMQDYLYGIGVALPGKGFLGLDPDDQKTIFNNALTNHLFEGRFSERVELSETVNQLGIKLVKGDKRSEQLLAAANDAGIVNPFRAESDPRGQEYTYGDTIYVREKLESRDKREEKNGGGGDDTRNLYTRLYSQLGSVTLNDNGIPNNVTEIPPAFLTGVRYPGNPDMLLKYFDRQGNAGFYMVKKDNTTVPVGSVIKNPQAVYSTYAPK